MTSTNDGKDVKSIQSSGQKGKSYYIELYKSLDARLSGDCDLRSRTQHLCEAWRRVHSLCLHALPATHPHLFSWLEKHTSRTILQTEWQLPQSKEDHTRLTDAIDSFIADTDARARSKDGVKLPWEVKLQQRGEWFKTTLCNPWGHEVLKALLQGETPGDDEILEWLKEERGLMFVSRLKQLTASKSKCSDLAMALVTAVMDRVRATTELVPDTAQVEEPKEKPASNENPTFADLLRSEAGFTADVWEVLTDIELVLLHKVERHAKCIELAKQIPLRNGFHLVERLQSRLDGAPREKKLWKNAKEVATLVAQVVIARCMVVPVCASTARQALYCCARSLVRLLPTNRLASAAAALAAPAATARHLHTLAQAVDAQLQWPTSQEMKPFVCELYVRAITAGMNELERLKLKAEKEAEARASEQMLSGWFTQLGTLLQASERIRCECALTAFSVHPAPDMYEILRTAPTLPTLNIAKDTQDAQEESTSEFGSWTTDSRTQSNLVKTSETLNMKQSSSKQANVLSTAILTEGERIGLSAELCQDLAVLLSGPRVKTLSWDMDRKVLLENCRTYMERTHGGTRALTTELKYLNLDPSSYMHLPEERDDEDDLYYGIEKGYEHLVEIQEPEDVWQDPFEDPEMTESACSSSMEVDPTTNKKKKKNKRPVPVKQPSSEEDDPLSILAEGKRTEKKKERPHSKERSRERKETKKKTKPKDAENKEGSRERRKEKVDKEKKERKPRKKKQEEEPSSLSSLIGLKVTKINIPEGKYKRDVDTKGISVTDSDYDSQGKTSIASLNSEVTNPDTVVDGVFSMDYQSPENDPLGNSELSVANGKVSIGAPKKPLKVYPMTNKPNNQVKPPSNAPSTETTDIKTQAKNVNAVREQVKKSISKLIEFRRQNALHENQRNSASSPSSTASSPQMRSETPVYKSPNAIIRQEYPDPPLITSPKALVVPEIPKVYINKTQTEKLQELKQGVDVLVNAKHQKQVQYPSNKPTQFQYNDAFLQSVFRPDVQPSKHTEPSKSLNNDTVHQQNFQAFLRELQESINAGTGANKVATTSTVTKNTSRKKEIKPISRVKAVVPNILRSEPGTSQSAKSTIQTAKKDQLNTFSRLSYMHKFKHGDVKRATIESLIDYQDRMLTLQKAIDDQKSCKLKYLQSKGDVVVSRVGQTPQNLSMKEEAKVVIKKVEKPCLNTFKDHPMLASMLSNATHGAIPKQLPKQESLLKSNLHQIEKPKPDSALSEKDQNDLLLLLRQQNKLNRPIIYANTDVNRNTSNTTVQFSNNCVTTNTQQNQATVTNRSVIKNLPTEIKYNNTHNDTSIKTIPYEAVQNAYTKADNSTFEDRKSISPMKINVTLSKVSNITPNSLETVTNVYKKPETKSQNSQDWESVMEALLKQKTPSRGLNALELTLKKDGGSSLRHQRINRIHHSESETKNKDKLHTQSFTKATCDRLMVPVVETQGKTDSNKQQTNTVIKLARPNLLPDAHGQSISQSHTQFIAKHVMPDRVTRPTVSETVTRTSSQEVKLGYRAGTQMITKQVDENITRPHDLEVKDNNSKIVNISKQIIPERVKTQLTPDAQIKNNEPTVARHVMPPVIHKKVNWIQTPVNERNIKKQNHTQIQPEVIKKLIVEVPKRVAEIQKKLPNEFVKEKDVYASSIPNSDYDLLDELMDDELRQEIGELSSDEESYRMNVNNSKGSKTLTNKYPNMSKDTLQDNVQVVDLRSVSIPAQNIQNVINQVNKSNQYQNTLNIDAKKTSQVQIPTITSTENRANSTSMLQQQTSNVVNNQTNNGEQAYNICKKVNSNHINYVDPRNVIITAVPQPVITQPVIPNVVVLGTDLVYDPFTVQTHLQTGICNVNPTLVTLNTAPNIRVYQTTQFAAPVVNEVIIGNSRTMPATASETITSVPSHQTKTQDMPTSQPIDIKQDTANKISVLNTVSDFAKQDTTKKFSEQDTANKLPQQNTANKFPKYGNITNSVIVSEKPETINTSQGVTHESKINVDINSNKNCERNIFTEMPEKQTFNQTENNVKKDEKDTDKTKGNQQAPEIKFENVTKKNSRSQERLIQRRMAIQNRISHNICSIPIALGYTPLKPIQKPNNIISMPRQIVLKDNKIVSDQQQAIDNSKNNTEIETPCEVVNKETEIDSTKENEQTKTPYRRILLRSSNDIKALKVASSIDQKNPVGRKTKVRLKNTIIKSTETPVIQKINIDKSKAEKDLSPVRVSKRILNRKIVKQNKETNGVEVDSIIVPSVKISSQIVVAKKDVPSVDQTDIGKKTVEEISVVLAEPSEFAVFDIEDAIEGSKICKVRKSVEKPIVNNECTKSNIDKPENIDNTNNSNIIVKKVVKRKKAKENKVALNNLESDKQTNKFTDVESGAILVKKIITRTESSKMSTSTSQVPANKIVVPDKSIDDINPATSVVDKAIDALATPKRIIRTTAKFTTEVIISNTPQVPSNNVLVPEKGIKDIKTTTNVTEKAFEALVTPKRILRPTAKFSRESVISTTPQISSNNTVVSDKCIENIQSATNVVEKAVDALETPKKIVRPAAKIAREISIANAKMHLQKLSIDFETKTVSSTEVKVPDVVRLPPDISINTKAKSSTNVSNVPTSREIEKPSVINSIKEMEPLIVGKENVSNKKQNIEPDSLTAKKDIVTNVQSNIDTKNKISDSVTEQPIPTKNKDSQSPDSLKTLESLKDKIVIEEIKLPQTSDSDKKCVRIKMPNGKAFKATVYGKMHVSFESLFEDQSLRNTLLNSMNDTKRYTVNIKQISTTAKNNPNNIVQSRIEEVKIQYNFKTNAQSQPIETVNLLSDDEDEQPSQTKTEVQTFKIQNGEYKMTATVDKDDLIKHQNRMQQTCFIELVDIKKSQPQLMPQEKPDTVVQTEMNLEKQTILIDNLLSTAIKEIEKSSKRSAVIDNETIIIPDVISTVALPQAEHNQEIVVPNVTDLPKSDVIEIDDSSNDSVKMVHSPVNLTSICNDLFTSLKIPVPTVKTDTVKNPADDIDELKNLLLKDLGVNLASDTNKALEEVSSKDSKTNHIKAKLRDCYVKLQNCDELVKKYEQIRIMNEEKIFSIARCRCDDAKYSQTGSDVEDNLNSSDDFINVDALTVESKLSRSGSFSLLDDLSAYDYDKTDNFPGLDGRNSPVMEVFDMISSLRKKVRTTEHLSVMEVFDLIASLRKQTPTEKQLTKKIDCFCDWYATKRDLHICCKDLLETETKINDVPLFYESTFKSSLDVKTNSIPTLKTLTAKVFQDQNILNRFVLLQSPSHKLKRKICNHEEISVANKLLKVVNEPKTSDNDILVSDTSSLEDRTEGNEKELQDICESDETSVFPKPIVSNGNAMTCVQADPTLEEPTADIEEPCSPSVLADIGIDELSAEGIIALQKLDDVLVATDKIQMNQDSDTSLDAISNENVLNKEPNQQILDTKQKSLVEKSNDIINTKNKLELLDNSELTVKDVHVATDEMSVQQGDCEKVDLKEQNDNNLINREVEVPIEDTVELVVSSTGSKLAFGEKNNHIEESVNLHIDETAKHSDVTKMETVVKSVEENNSQLASDNDGFTNTKVDTNNYCIEENLNSLVSDTVTERDPELLTVESDSINEQRIAEMIQVDPSERIDKREIPESAANGFNTGAVEDTEHSDMPTICNVQKCSESENEVKNVIVNPNENVCMTAVSEDDLNNVNDNENEENKQNTVDENTNTDKCEEDSYCTQDNEDETKADAVESETISVDIQKDSCSSGEYDSVTVETKDTRSVNTNTLENKASNDTSVLAVIECNDNDKNSDISIATDRDMPCNTDASDNKADVQNNTESKSNSLVLPVVEEPSSKNNKMDSLVDNLGLQNESKHNNKKSESTLPVFKELSSKINTTDTLHIDSGPKDDSKYKIDKDESILITVHQEIESNQTNHESLELVTEVESGYVPKDDLVTSKEGTPENTRECEEEKTSQHQKQVEDNTKQDTSLCTATTKNTCEEIADSNDDFEIIERVIVISDPDVDSTGISFSPTSVTVNPSTELEMHSPEKVSNVIDEKADQDPMTLQMIDHEYALKDVYLKENILRKVFNESDSLESDENNVLQSKNENEYILNGIEYEDPEVGTCYVFPIADNTSASSCENDDLFEEETEEIIQVIQEIDEDGTVGNVTLETKEVSLGDDYFKLNLPKMTYSRLNRTSKYRTRRPSKRKMESMMNDQIFVSKKRPRKSRKFDIPETTAGNMIDNGYSKEFKQIFDYCSSLKFSYTQPYHKEFIDVDEIIRNWPLRATHCDEFQGECHDDSLFTDIERQKVFDPVDLSFANELSFEYTESDSPSNVDKQNFSMGFGEGSDRVIQNLRDVDDDSKFSAATLSDVKQPQPFVMSEEYNKCETDKDEVRDMRDDQIKQLRRYLNYVQMRDKVRSFFKKSTVELRYEWIRQEKEHFSKDLFNFPFELYNTMDFMEPPANDVVVQVVQVGQLPVSAAAQNPVTCDPRVTQVSDASPSQCSVENSPHDDSQASIKTEYTELTTADLSVPLMQEYAQHNQSLPTDLQDPTNMSMSDDNIPIETEIKSVVKIELIDDGEDKEEPQENYENCDPQDDSKHDNLEYSFDTNSTHAIEYNVDNMLYNNTSEKQDVTETYPIQQEQKQNGAPEKTDQIAHAMNAAGITTTSETMTNNTRAHALVNILSQKLRQAPVGAAQATTNTYAKTTSINAMALQQALAQILPPPLNQTNANENNQQPNTPQVLHIVQGKNTTGSQITLVDNSQQSVINAPNATPVLHIVQNKSGQANATSNGSATPQTNTFGGLSLVDAGLQQGGNQLLHIVNTGGQKNSTAAGQLLKRVNLLTNLANVQGSNEQKMVQFVCKSADGKSIQLNAPHQRSMVLRLQPIETPNVQATQPKPAEQQELSPTSTATNSLPVKDNTASQQEIKSRSVYEENYAKFIQNSSTKTGSEKATSLPKFNQAFGKPVFQDGNQTSNDLNTNNSHLSVNTKPESSDCQATDNAINLDHIGQLSSPPLLLRKSPAQPSQTQANLVQQLKQTITPMNIQTMHGGVIYTRQIPVNIGGGQTINLITVPSTELVDDSTQKQQTIGNQNEIEQKQSIIKIVPQNQTASNSEMSSEEGGGPMNVSNEPNQNPQPQPVLTQMRIKLPMLSKAPQMVSGARVVRPSFFQIQRNVIGGTNQPVYQQLVLTAAPPLGQQTIRLPQAQTNRIKVDNQSSAESQMSSSTLEQLREFDMVLEQVKERSSVPPSSSSNSFSKLHSSSSDTTDGSASSSSTETTQQVLYSIGNSHQPLNVAYVNRKATVATPTTSTFVRSPDSSGIVDSPTSSTHVQIPHTVTTDSSHSDTPSQPKKSSSKSKSRPKASSNPPSNLKLNTVPPKTSTQKPLEDEQTTQRILYILAEYKEQVENSPDKDKPAPRRRSNPPSNPSGSSKRKKSSSGSRRPGTRDISPIHGEDTCRTMGSEDSSCGTSQGDCNESCLESHSPQDSPRKVVRKLTFEQETPAPTPRPQPQRNVIVADGQTITVARGTAGKPTTAVLMPANYILPVSMVKGGQQIAIVTNRGPKLLTVGGGEGGATNALLLQRLIGPAGLKPVLARPGVRHVRLPTAALHNLQAFNLTTATTVQPPDSTASPAPAPTPPELVDTRATSSPWTDRDCQDVKPERGSSPEGSEPWNLPSSGDPHDYSYEETVRADNLDRTVLDPIPDRYSPDMEAQRIFDKMFDVESKKSYMGDSPRCAYDIDASDCDDKPFHQVVQKKDGSSHRQHRLTHVSAAALRHKYAILEHELRLQKSLSEECEDLGVDSPSASELFPEAELLFAASPAHDHQDQGHHSHTPQPTLNQSGIPHPDMDDQIATDQLLTRDMHEDQQDLNLGLEDVGIVTVSEDGMQATIALDQEEFARSHPNTTFHSEPEEGEVQPFTIGLKGRHITSTIFHSNRAPATVLMTAPQTTVISQATADHSQSSVKYSDIDNMINSLPSNGNNINLSSLVKDEGLTRFDSILSDSRELHLSNTASAIVHSAGNATQVIRRVCYDDDKRDNRFLMDEPDGLIAGDDAKMIAEDSSRDATLESMAGDVDDDRSSPERHAELFWESNSASERSESRRPLDFSSDSEKCCKSPSYDETNSTDSSGVGTHMRLDSVIKDARGIERSGSADGSSADDTHPPLRTYPPKRMYGPVDGTMERSLSGKTRAGEAGEHRESLEPRGGRRASGRGVVKRGCHCCNGSPAPPKPKKSRQRKPTVDFNTN